jgi:hypothetical protein
MTVDPVRRITTGAPLPGYVDTYLQDAFYANQESAHLFFALHDLLPNQPGSKYGVNPRMNGYALQGFYRKKAGANSAELAGPDVDFNYSKGGGNTPYETYMSQARVGLEFSQDEVDMLGNAVDGYFDAVEDEKREKVMELLTLRNAQLYDGDGQFVPGRRTTNYWGLRTILDWQTNDYYSVARPGTGELNNTLINNANVPANALMTFVEVLRNMVRLTNRPAPTFHIMNPSWIPLWITEGINPWGDVNRAVRYNINDGSAGFRHRELTFISFGEGYQFCFDPDIPGSGPSGTDNELIILNLSLVDLLWRSNYYWNDPEFEKGTKLQPLQHWANVYDHSWFRVRDPQSHIYAREITLPALTAGLVVNPA